MLSLIGEDIWISDGPELVAALGFHYPTRMTVIRLDDGGLVVWSPVALTAELKADVEALGAVRHVIAPNSLHHVFLGEWIRACPGAMVYAAPGLREKRADIRFDDDLADIPPPAWAGQMDQVVVNGNAIMREVVFFHRKSGTVLFTDLIQQLPPRWFSGWRRFVAKWDLMTEREPTVPRKFRLAFTNRTAARAAMRRVLDWPARKVVMAHGTPVTENAAAFLARAFSWLMR
jgi:hypothetical protein